MVVTSFCLWLGWSLERSRTHRDSVAAIRQAGGTVYYSYNIAANGQRIPDARSPHAAWLRRILGDEFFARVEMVFLEDATDELLESLRDHLGNLRTLDSLHLTHSKLTDKSAKDLAELTQLKGLYLGGNVKLTGATLAQISKLKNLKRLQLWHAQIKDTDMVHIRALGQLEELELSFDPITDNGLLHLQGLAKLRLLGLYDTNVTDLGLERLTCLANLKRMDLGETSVTDDGLRFFAQMPSLRFVSVTNTRVTRDGAEKLMAKHPSLTIKYSSVGGLGGASF